MPQLYSTLSSNQLFWDLCKSIQKTKKVCLQCQVWAQPIHLLTVYPWALKRNSNWFIIAWKPESVNIIRFKTKQWGQLLVHCGPTAGDCSDTKVIHFLIAWFGTDMSGYFPLTSLICHSGSNISQNNGQTSHCYIQELNAKKLIKDSE